MSLPGWVQQYKEPRTEIKHIKGHYYKYEVSYKYDKERKRSIKKTGRLLGKITEKDGFTESSKNKLRNTVQQLPKVDIKNYGIYALFSELLSEEISLLRSVFEDKTAEQLLSFALMRWAYQSPIKRLAEYHSHDFCSESWCTDRVLSDKEISSTLKNIGENRELVLQWMRKLLPESAANIEHFLLMDSTHMISLSEHLLINAKGYNPSFDFDKQIRLMYMFSQNFKKPVYYRLINGNITDISSMSLCIKEMNINNVVYIADKGFYSEDNLNAMDAQELNYLIPIHRNNNVINYNPLLQPDFKRTNKYFIYQKRIIWYYEYENNERKYITFLDERLRVEEEQDYLMRITTHPDKYSIEKYYEKLHTFGTLTLVHKTKSSPATDSAQQVYEAYKQRNEIETMFNSYKNFLEADKTYMQNRFVLEGWIFVNFIAMIAYYKLFDRLKNAELLTKFSPKDIIEIAKQTHQLKMLGAWHRSEITVKTKGLFKKLNVASLT